MNFGDNERTSCGNNDNNDNMLYRLLTAFFLTFATVFLVLPQQAEAQTYRFNSVQIEGNERVDGSTIVNYAGIARGTTVTAGQLNDAYRRVLDSGLFETVDFEPRGSVLQITVKENPTINRISFEGNKRIDDEGLGDIIGSTERRVFSASQAERDAALIAEAYSQQGRISARVTPRIIRRSSNRVDLVYEITEGGAIEVERVSFVGNKVYSDRRLRRVLETKQAGILRAFIRSDTLIEDRVEFDKQVLKDFYFSRGYIDFRTNSANAELSRERDGFFLVFNVEEGQQFRFGEITTTSEMPEADADQFQKALKIKPGVVYSPTLVENSIARMERLANDLGIDFMRVIPQITRNDRDLTLDVEFLLSRGPRVFVERIDVEGNTSTLDRVVRQQFKVVEGDPFNPREIRSSAERIRALGYFSKADVEAREGSAPDQVVIDVDVEEKPTGSLTLGGAYSTNSGFGVAIGLNENNFLGRGQQVGLKWSTAEENEEYSISFTEPFLLGRDLKFSINLGYSEADSSFASYDLKQAFFSPSLDFPISDNGRLNLRYSWNNLEMLQRPLVDITPNDNINNPVPVNGTVIGNEIASGMRTTSLIGLGYTFDSRRTGLNPNAGVLFEIRGDFAGLGGDNKFFKATTRAIAQTKILNEEVTLRASFEGGALRWRGNNNSRAVDRFLLGPSVMRGFEPGGIGPREVNGNVNDALGGNLYAVARLEAEFPLGLPEEIGLRGALFYDVGNLWNLDDAATAGVAPGTLVGVGGSFRHVIGVGLLWDTAIGPLRFNFTNAVRKETFDKEQSFDFTISTEF